MQKHEKHQSQFAQAKQNLPPHIQGWVVLDSLQTEEINVNNIQNKYAEQT